LKVKEIISDLIIAECGYEIADLIAEFKELMTERK